MFNRILMKKNILFLIVLLIFVSNSASAWWTTLYDRGTPWKTYYLGDYANDLFYSALNTNTLGWTVQYGFGKNADGTGVTWRDADFHQVNGSNYEWKSKSGEQQFNSTGNWYYAAKYTNGGYTEYASADWAADRTSSQMYSYVTVSSLSDPSDVTATAASSGSVSLSWTKWLGRNVMVLRKKSTESWTEPTGGTAYSVSSTIGDGVVVYNGSDASYTNTGLEPNTTYDYKYYSENYNYYSAGASAQVTTSNTSASDYFRSASNGSWSTASVWESSPNNTNWVTSTAAPGSSATTVYINNTITVGADLSLNGNLIVNADAILNVTEGVKLTVGSDLQLKNANSTINLGADATQTATLLCSGTFSNATGKITMKQQLTTDRTWYVSSPVAAGTAGLLVTNDGDVVYYDETNNSWTALNQVDALTAGKGYVVNKTVSTGLKTFTGVPNNGQIDVTLSKTLANTNYAGFNLLGNPYPSYYDLNTAIDNSPTNMETTFWLRSHSGSAYVFDTYNTTGNTGINNSSRTNFDGVIPPMQAFWLRTTANNTTFSFVNARRQHNAGTNTSFKSPSGAASEVLNKSLRLKVSNGLNSDETLIYFNPNASDAYDNFDSHKYFNSSAAVPELFTVVGGETLAINGMKEIVHELTVPLGFETATLGEFTINSVELSNFDSDVQIYLNDKVTGAETLLTETTAYSFTSDISNSTDRFSLQFRIPSTVTSINQSLQTNVKFTQNKDELRIEIPTSISAAQIQIFDLSGKLLQSIQSNQSVVNMQLPNEKGVYIVKVACEEQQIMFKALR